MTPEGVSNVNNSELRRNRARDSSIVDYATSFARSRSLETAVQIGRDYDNLRLSTPGQKGVAELFVGPGWVTLALGEYEYHEVTDMSTLQGAEDDDRELFEILIVAAQNWLNGQWEEVELKGCFGRCGTGVRINFLDGEYIELAKKGRRFLAVQHKWFWGDWGRQ